MNEANVLGQRKYRGNHDPNLAERLNAEVAEEKRREELKEKQRKAREKAEQDAKAKREAATGIAPATRGKEASRYSPPTIANEITIRPPRKGIVSAPISLEERIVNNSEVNKINNDIKYDYLKFINYNIEEKYNIEKIEYNKYTNEFKNNKMKK